MPRKGKPTQEADSSSELLERLQAMRGRESGLKHDEIDARLLWMVVQILCARRASVSIGVTRDASSYVVQFWDGKFPVKDYFRSTDDLNRHLAALIRADMGKEASVEWNEILQLYGW